MTTSIDLLHIPIFRFNDPRLLFAFAAEHVALFSTDERRFDGSDL